jgi:hypothetical protein
MKPATCSWRSFSGHSNVAAFFLNAQQMAAERRPRALLAFDFGWNQTQHLRHSLAQIKRAPGRNSLRP